VSRLLPYGDANAIVMEMPRSHSGGRAHAGLAGVCGTTVPLMKLFLRDGPTPPILRVQNFPTVGLFDGRCEEPGETGMGFGLEVDLIRHGARDELTDHAVLLHPDEAAAMAQAGADILIPHMGLTTRA